MILEFPQDRPHLNDLADWISGAVPGCPKVEGPVEVLQVKRWGVTATYRVGDRLVVVKDAHPPLFPAAAAVHRLVQRVCPDATAPLLADATADSWQRTVFEFVPGHNADDMKPKPLADIARRLGEIQVALVGTDFAGLPSYDIVAIGPDLLADLSTSDDQPAETVRWLKSRLPDIEEWSAELAAGCPLSLDHPDLNPSNALIGEHIVIIDWEEAVVGAPMMSLYRLLRDAAEAGCVAEVKAAYLGNWGHLPEPDRLLELALRLAPLKLAAEAREYARGLGWDHPHQRLTARLLTDARAAWDR